MTQAQKDAFDRYRASIAEVASKPKITYREVMTFPDAARVQLAEHILDKNIFGYALRYYSLTHRNLPPLLVFMIIDSEEVILAFYRGVHVEEEEIYLSIRHPKIARLFQEYYNSIWRGAKVIKEAGKLADMQVFERIKRSLSQEEVH